MGVWSGLPTCRYRYRFGQILCWCTPSVQCHATATYLGHHIYGWKTLDRGTLQLRQASHQVICAPEVCCLFRSA